MLHRVSSQDPENDDDERETDIVVDDLDQTWNWAKNAEVPGWLVRQSLPHTKKGILSRPQSVFGEWKREKPVPKSILYDTFALMVNEVKEADVL
jgi:hypothetical protein